MDRTKRDGNRKQPADKSKSDKKRACCNDGAEIENISPYFGEQYSQKQPAKNQIVIRNERFIPMERRSRTSVLILKSSAVDMILFFASA